MKLLSYRFQGTKIILGLILVLAAVLRFGWMGMSPPSLNWDEASLGYNAYSILETGKDEWGRFLPLTFEAFGDYKLPGYVYALVPFVRILGLNEVSVRLPSQISGVFTVYLVFLITRQFLKGERWALFSAFLLAVSPWHIFLSRIALEANLAFAFFLSGFYFFLLGFKRNLVFIPASFFFGITVFTYNSARVFLPLFLIALAIIYWRELLKVKKQLVLPVLILAIFLGTAGYLAVYEDSSSRYFWVSILDEGAINFINEQRGGSNLPPNLGRFVYNKGTFFAFNFVKNYLEHFSPVFLFKEGGTNYQFSVPGTGLLYWIELPFLLLGIYWMLKRKIGKPVVWWLLLAPIPAAVTRESPHVLRSIYMLGALQVIAAFGIIYTYNFLKKSLNFKVYAFLFVTILLLELSLYFKYYLYEYPKKYSQSWQYGIKEAIEYVNTKENLNQRPLFITKKYGEAHIFYLFYNQYDPSKYQNNPNLIRYEKSNWRWIDRVDNVFFINDWEIKEKLKDLHGYLITTEGNYPGTPAVQKVIKFLDGTVAFEVVEI